MSPKFCAECGAALNELGRCPMKCDEVAPRVLGGASDSGQPVGGIPSAGDLTAEGFGPMTRRESPPPSAAPKAPGPLTYPKFEALRKKGAI